MTRNHPTWKRPQNGIVALRDTSVALNLALYMVESEQRLAAMITDVVISALLIYVITYCLQTYAAYTYKETETVWQYIHIGIRNLKQFVRAMCV